MGLKPIVIDLFHLFNLHFGIHRKWHHEANKKLPFYLPFGKAEDTPSPEPVRLWRVAKGSR